jgi:hypothetical protein
MSTTDDEPFDERVTEAYRRVAQTDLPFASIAQQVVDEHELDEKC